jgi:hypothetical protein
MPGLKMQADKVVASDSPAEPHECGIAGCRSGKAPFEDQLHAVRSLAVEIVTAHFLENLRPGPPRRPLTILESGALSNLDNVTVGIADVAARLAILGDRLGDELGSATLP